MDRVRAAGITLTAIGLGGYAAGIAAPYPGRGFSIFSVMVGLTLLVIGGGR